MTLNINLMSTVSHNLVKFHSGTSTQTPHSVTTCSVVALQFLADIYLKDTRRQNVC